MIQTTIYIDESQKKRVDKLPRRVSFSQLVRDHFDDIVADYEEKPISLKVAN